MQITFHNMPHDVDIESAIRANAEWLDNFYDRIMSCRVVVDRPHLHHQEGNLYQIRIDLKVPGRELAVKREPSEHTDYKDLNIMIRDAFDEARRQLEDYARRQRGEIKARELLPHARVARVFPGDRIRLSRDARRPGGLLPQEQCRGGKVRGHDGRNRGALRRRAGR